MVAVWLLGGAGGLFAEEWFDAYESGLDALAKRQGPQAVGYFERAIRKRASPGENLLTYGTNRIDKYHPYLRLAEAHLMAGNPEAARRVLDRSLEINKEPADERGRLISAADAALLKMRAAAATPTPTAVPVSASTPSQVTAVPLPVAAPTAASSSTPAPLTPASVPAAAAAGTLIVVSDPAGAIVLLDGAIVGETPLRLEKRPGEYTVKLRRDGFAEQTFAVKVTAGKPTRQSRTLTATATPAAPRSARTAERASILVLTDPPGASISLDDEHKGLTDPLSGRLVVSGVAAGPHVVRASLPGRKDELQTVEVSASGPNTALLVLPPPRTGRSILVVAGLVAIIGAMVVVVVGYGLRRRRETLDSTVALASPVTPTPRRAATPPTPGQGRRAAATPRPTSGRQTVVEAESETRGLDRTPPDAESFGSYLLIEQIGKGGMAQVFLAERNGELCALKRPLASFLDEPEFLKRFSREAEIGHTLHHPNIIRIHERGEVDGIPYFAMEWVKGQTLQDILRGERSLDLEWATWSAQIIVQVAEALDYAHLKGVIHRDLKPSNIMVLDDGTAKVMDYGIARARRFEGLTLTGSFLGTPDYVAPETAEGKGSDARSDLYSLGVVFYECLTGRKPFQGDTPYATLRKHCSEPVIPPSQVNPHVPRELEAIVMKLLEKVPERRYPGAEELLIDLKAYLNRAA